MQRFRRDACGEQFDIAPRYGGLKFGHPPARVAIIWLACACCKLLPRFRRGLGSVDPGHNEALKNRACSQDTFPSSK